MTSASLIKAIEEAKAVGSEHLAVWIYEIEDLVAAKRAAERRLEKQFELVQAFIIEIAHDQPYTAERLEATLLVRMQEQITAVKAEKVRHSSNGSLQISADEQRFMDSRVAV
jgi:hypothetical protein